MPRFQQGGPIPHKKPGEGSDAPPTLKRSGSERQEERLHPLPFWKGRGLGSGLRTPSSQEGDRGVEKCYRALAAYYEACNAERFRFTIRY